MTQDLRPRRPVRPSGLHTGSTVERRRLRRRRRPGPRRRPPRPLSGHRAGPLDARRPRGRRPNRGGDRSPATDPTASDGRPNRGPTEPWRATEARPPTEAPADRSPAGRCVGGHVRALVSRYGRRGGGGLGADTRPPSGDAGASTAPAARCRARAGTPARARARARTWARAATGAALRPAATPDGHRRRPGAAGDARWSAGPGRTGADDRTVPIGGPPRRGRSASPAGPGAARVRCPSRPPDRRSGAARPGRRRAGSPAAGTTAPPAPRPHLRRARDARPDRRRLPDRARGRRAAPDDPGADRRRLPSPAPARRPRHDRRASGRRGSPGRAAGGSPGRSLTSGQAPARVASRRPGANPPRAVDVVHAGADARRRPARIRRRPRRPRIERRPPADARRGSAPAPAAVRPGRPRRRRDAPPRRPPGTASAATTPAPTATPDGPLPPAALASPVAAPPRHRRRPDPHAADAPRRARPRRGHTPGSPRRRERGVVVGVRGGTRRVVEQPRRSAFRADGRRPATRHPRRRERALRHGSAAQPCVHRWWRPQHLRRRRHFPVRPTRHRRAIRVVVRRRPPSLRTRG